MYELSVRTHFSAAHHLREYDGKCADPHGHNWQVEVFVCGEHLNCIGILVDYRLLKDAVKDVLSLLDHADLNAVQVFHHLNPTSENIASFLFHELSRKLNNDNYKVSRVAVGETPETTATYYSSK